MIMSTGSYASGDRALTLVSAHRLGYTDDGIREVSYKQRTRRVDIYDASSDPRVMNDEQLLFPARYIYTRGDACGGMDENDPHKQCRKPVTKVAMYVRLNTQGNFAIGCCPCCDSCSCEFDRSFGSYRMIDVAEAFATARPHIVTNRGGRKKRVSNKWLSILEWIKSASPNKEFTVDEVARKHSTENCAVSARLSKFHKEGALTKSKRGKVVYYKAC